jgi:hypothetical protein
MGTRPTVLYLPAQNAIFFHIPKTGGTTLTALLHPYVAVPKKKLPDLGRLATQWRNYAAGWQGTNHLDGKQHSTYRDCEARFPELRAGAFTFAFVRNPWDRAASMWRDLFAAAEPFDETLQAQIPHKGLTRPTQKAYLVDQSGRVKVDFIGRYEHFEDDVRRLFARLGIPIGHIPRLLPSGAGKHYAAYYNPRSRAFIADYFREDIEEFGYQFEAAPAEAPE